MTKTPLRTGTTMRNYFFFFFVPFALVCWFALRLLFHVHNAAALFFLLLLLCRVGAFCSLAHSIGPSVGERRVPIK